MRCCPPPPLKSDRFCLEKDFEKKKNHKGKYYFVLFKIKKKSLLENLIQKHQNVPHENHRAFSSEW